MKESIDILNTQSEEDSFRCVLSKRRNHRSRRIDVMKEFESGIVDERPIKERFSREFKKAKIKKIKNPIENIGKENCIEGLVIEVHRRTCEVLLKNSKEILSETINDYSENIVTAMYRATTSKQLGEFPAVGDNVLLGLVNDIFDEGEGVGSQKYCVVRVLKRKSLLKRPGPRDSFYKEQTLAANIDQVVIVASVHQPEFNYGFMDRFLLAANLNNLPFILVLTKIDLLPNGLEDLSEDIRDFMSIVDKVIPLSIKTNEGFKELCRELDGKSSVFSGQSGVGKSSLINKLVPYANLETGSVRKRDGKGKHTTISSSLFKLPKKEFLNGGIVIDTPGIRGLGIMDMENETLAKIFPGFFEGDLFTCKFSNCLHIKEPGCAVRKALEKGALSYARYRSYLRILNSKN